MTSVDQMRRPKRTKGGHDHSSCLWVDQNKPKRIYLMSKIKLIAGDSIRWAQSRENLSLLSGATLIPDRRLWLFP
jgi:hypothetical protein